MAGRTPVTTDVVGSGSASRTAAPVGDPKSGPGVEASGEPTLSDYQRAAALRAAIRAFLRRGEEAARRAGLTPRRQLLLLMIKGAPDGSERATVSDLAVRLRLAQNTVTELVTRAEEAGLLRREGSERDGRVVYLRLTPEGESRLAATVAELRADRANLAKVLSQEHELQAG
jgi:DNA-binding MarR family transcriptional regulator